jgi:hypothetical protein
VEHNILAGVVVAIRVILGTQLLKRSNASLNLAKRTKVHLYELAIKFWRRYLLPSKQLNARLQLWRNLIEFWEVD